MVRLNFSQRQNPLTHTPLNIDTGGRLAVYSLDIDRTLTQHMATGMGRDVGTINKDKDGGGGSYRWAETCIED